MKLFLSTCTLAMLAAGIYGTVDLSRDLQNGTFIQYEEEEDDLPAVAQFASSSKGIFRRTNVKVAHKEPAKKTAPPTLINSFADLEFSDFSRGEPPMIYEAMLLEELSRPDSIAAGEVNAAISDTVKAISEMGAENAKSDSSSLAKKEERKFSYKLYSRGRPPRLAKKEDSVLATDTVKPPFLTRH